MVGGSEWTDMKTIEKIPDWEQTNSGTVEKMEHGAFTSSDGWSLGWNKEWGAEPKVGDEIITVGSFGRPVRGIVVNGEVRWYQTEEDWRSEFEAEKAEKDRLDRIKWIDKYPAWIIQYHELPEVFRQRLNRFIGARDGWIRKFGPYEMMVCADAVKIGNWFKKVGVTEENYELLNDWQFAKEVGMSDGHSGNSAGAAKHLGWWYAKGDDDTVINSHGALTPLVGCEEFGCVHE